VARCTSNAVIVLGGYRGLMRAVADAALERGLRVLMVIPEAYEKDPFPPGSIIVRTGLGYRERSLVLVRTSDILVSLGGGLGTLFEELIAHSIGIPVLRLVIPGDRLTTDRLASCFPSGVLDDRLQGKTDYSSNGRELADKVCSIASSTRR